MELNTLKELGIAGISIGAMGYITFRALVMLGETQKDYKNYVSENNHTTTELVREATATIVEVRNSIENHNKISEKLLDKLDKYK